MEVSTNFPTDAKRVRRKPEYVPDDPLLSAAEAAVERGQALSTFWRDVAAGRVPQRITSRLAVRAGAVRNCGRALKLAVLFPGKLGDERPYAAGTASVSWLAALANSG